THHRAPSSFVPTHTPIGKAYLQLAVVVIIQRNNIGQPGSYSGHTDRPGISHLAHDIDIMHSAIHNRTTAFHQATVHIPFPAMALLVQVHPEYQRCAHLSPFFDKSDPGRVVTKNISYDKFLVCPHSRIY